MIHTQSRAFCQCDFCKSHGGIHQHQPDLTVLDTSRMAKGVGKDELYYQSLRNSMKMKSMAASQKNESRFIPDEQLVSSRNARMAKDVYNASPSIPLRRRDHLQELLILENKHRLREEGLLAQQMNPNESQVPPAAETAAPVAVFADTVVRPSSAGSNCSAEKDLKKTISAVKEIVGRPGTEGRLTLQQTMDLRAVVREQENKARRQIEECGLSHKGLHHPNCLSDSAPSALQPQEQYRNISSHPYGTGVVFLPFDDSTKPKPKETRPAVEEAVRAPTSKPAVVESPENKASGSHQQYQTSSSMWRTSSQIQAAEMDRYLNSVKKLQENSKKVYAS